MADITMCTDMFCPLKETCYRFNAPVNEYRQAYFSKTPNPEHKMECDSYWKIHNKSKEK